LKTGRRLAKARLWATSGQSVPASHSRSTGRFGRRVSSASSQSGLRERNAGAGRPGTHTCMEPKRAIDSETGATSEEGMDVMLPSRPDHREETHVVHPARARRLFSAPCVFPRSKDAPFEAARKARRI